MLAVLAAVLVACGGSPESQNGIEARLAIIAHMHEHAGQLKQLNDALAAEDLEAAGKAARWLSRHEQFPDLPEGWAPFVWRIRTQAEIIGMAPDLATARKAASRLAEGCTECHRSNGVEADVPTL